MHFVFGTAMHEAIQHYLQTMFDQSAKVADEMDLNKFFKDKMIEVYTKYKKKHGHFATPELLQEFYLDMSKKRVEKNKRKKLDKQ